MTNHAVINDSHKWAQNKSGTNIGKEEGKWDKDCMGLQHNIGGVNGIAGMEEGKNVSCYL